MVVQDLVVFAEFNCSFPFGTHVITCFWCFSTSIGVGVLYLCWVPGTGYLPKMVRLLSYSVGRPKSPFGDGPPSRPTRPPNKYLSSNPARRGYPATCPVEQPSKAGLSTNARRATQRGEVVEQPTHQATQQDDSRLSKSRPSTIRPCRHDETSSSHAQTVEAVPRDLYQARHRIHIPTVSTTLD